MDEVGRGTGTKDGLAIAWAVSEELLDAIRCRTFFATHYHELSSITHPRLANRSMEVLDNEGELVFLRKLKDGAAAESYGLHAARLAGLSGQVLDRAWRIMERLQANERAMGTGGIPAAAQADQAFAPARTSSPQSSGSRDSADREPAANNEKSKQYDALIGEIAALDINSLTPLEAFNRIYNWKLFLEGKGIRPGARPHKQRTDEGASLFD
jgi:DNA mismatch repair protein MutS